MKVVLALGNPGTRYTATRHNIGWMVADAVAERLNLEFRPGKGEYYEAQGSWKGEKTLLVKPTTYMNNSGLAAAQVMERHKVGLSDILVIVDEIQFPVGRIQVKPSGSSGGHNGMESLMYHLDSNAFPRLRCGIGRDFGPGEMAEYVLSRFPQQEEALVADMIARARDVTLAWIAEGTTRAMSICNVAATGEKSARPGSEANTSRPADDPTDKGS